MSIIKNTEDYDPIDSGQRLLAVGNSGMGKTYFLGLIDKRLKQLGHEKGLLILDFDLGMKTLKSNNFKVDYISIPKPLAHDDNKGFILAQKILRKLASDNLLGYAAVAIDSYTTLIKHFEAAIHNDSKTNRRLSSIGLHLSNENDWGAVIQSAETFLFHLAALSQFGHLIVTIHLRRILVKVNKEIVRTDLVPMAPGQSLPYNMGRFFNEVWHFKRNSGPTGAYYIETVQYSELNAKTQSLLPPKLSIERAIDLCFPLEKRNPSMENQIKSSEEDVNVEIKTS